MSKTREIQSKFAERILSILEEKGKIRRSEILKKIRETDKTLFQDKSPDHRFGWASMFLKSGGFLVQEKGNWYLTEKGQKYAKEKKFQEAYEEGDKNWYEDYAKRKYEEKAKLAELQGEESSIDSVSPDEENSESNQNEDLEDLEFLEENGRKLIKGKIAGMDGYAFQSLVASLLRGMGYYVKESNKGRDGGIDILAFQDPLGAKSPRIIVQVKHHQGKIGPSDIQRHFAISGEDLGLFISTGGFSPEAKRDAQARAGKMQLIDLEDFIDLWLEFYDKLSFEDREKLPIRKIAFPEN